MVTHICVGSVGLLEIGQTGGAEKCFQQNGDQRYQQMWAANHDAHHRRSVSGFEGEDDR